MIGKLVWKEAMMSGFQARLAEEQLPIGLTPEASECLFPKCTRMPFSGDGGGTTPRSTPIWEVFLKGRYRTSKNERAPGRAALSRENESKTLLQSIY